MWILIITQTLLVYRLHGFAIDIEFDPLFFLFYICQMLTDQKEKHKNKTSCFLF